MQPHLQRVELGAVDDQLAIHDEMRDAQRGDVRRHLREKARQWTLAARLQGYVAAVAEHQAAEAIVFRFVAPAGFLRQRIDRFGLHRFE